MKIITIFLLTCMSLCANAQWSGNNSINNAICNFAGSQMLPQITSDGAGGAICTWVDTRNGTQDIYAQRVDANGNLQWNADGISICNAVSDQFSPKLVSDGSGGAIITWYDNRNGNWDLYAQRINATGVVQWTTDGVAICTATGNQNAQQIISDGAGGAIIVWSDGRFGGPNADINAQRINASGSVLWTADGTSVCSATSLQNIPQLISDGAGGAIIAWEDWRSFSQSDIYAQRISSNGFANWSFNGVVICSEPNLAQQSNVRIVASGVGGAIICWQDNRNFGTGLDIYAQKVNSSGTTQWISNGLAVCTAPFVQTSQQMIPDGDGGAIFAWDDRRVSGESDIYAQHFNTSGTAQWTLNGMAICNSTGLQSEPQLTARSSGGALIIWTDARNSGQGDIYAQSVTATGSVLWNGNGVPVANESHSQFAPQLIPNGIDGAIIAWQDLRTTLDYDIYSSKLFSNGTLPVRLVDFTLSNDLDFVRLQWKSDNEINNRGFEIQRSQDGAYWQTIEFIVAGTANSRIENYHWEDRTPLSGKSFYRLKQIDNDGKFEYTKILSVNRYLNTTLSVYPNPAKERMQVNYGRIINNGKLELYNNFGQLVFTQVIIGQSSSRVELKHFSAGMYTLYLTVGEDRIACKIMIE